MATITKYNIPRNSNSAENNGSNVVSVLGGGLGLNEIKENFLPATPTDEEQTKYDVEVEGTFKKNVTLPSITLKSSDGEKTATISLDENGDILIDKSVFVRGDAHIAGTITAESDVVAYSNTSTSNIMVLSLADEVAAPHSQYLSDEERITVLETKNLQLQQRISNLEKIIENNGLLINTNA